jgi:hypothetical protein
MRLIGRHAAAALAAFVLCAAATAPARAGVFVGWGEYDRQLAPGAVVPGDGEPFSHRYNYYVGPSFYLGMDYNHFLYMDYLDRLDRAEKFGYRIPDPPAFLYQGRCRPCGR